MKTADMIADVLAQLDTCRIAMRDLNLARAIRALNKARAMLRAARACQRIDDDERKDPSTPSTHETPDTPSQIP